jgi:TonB family protein
MKRSISGLILGAALAVALPAAAQDLRPVHRVDPDFPTEAVRAGATKGKVTVRLTIDAAGKVTNVEIVDAIPRRLFDRAVQRALADWRLCGRPRRPRRRSRSRLQAVRSGAIP